MQNSHRSFHARTLLRTRNHVGFRNRSHVSTTSNRKNASFCEIIRGQRIGSRYDYYKAKRPISTIRFLEPRNASGIESLSDDVTTVLLTKLDLANDWIENCAAKVIWHTTCTKWNEILLFIFCVWLVCIAKRKKQLSWNSSNERNVFYIYIFLSISLNWHWNNRTS